MPKGVDHSASGEKRARVKEVQKSLMPKGVDHPELLTERFPTWNVQKSLMPKGVDHQPSRLSDLLQLSVRAKIFDAERR